MKGGVADFPIRRAVPGDAPALASFGARTFAETFGPQNRAEDMAAYLGEAYGVAQQKREIEDPNSITLLVESERELIAHAQLRVTPPSVEIARFYVDRPWQGRGVAHSMMRAAFDAASSAGADRIWLAVWERNPRAIAFYERCGFRDIGSQPFLLGTDHQTDRVMEASLRSAVTNLTIAPPLVVIAPTWFTMGSDAERDDERPAHRVWVDRFELGMCQVSNAEYDVFVKATDHAAAPRRNDPSFDHPDQSVVAVSWFDAVSYCDWLRTVTGRRFRLPFEAEWECAARGGAEGKLYPWGDAPPQSRADYDKRWIHGPERCATAAPNPYGLYDMCENLHEWCSDWYGREFYAISPERNPRGPESGSRRVSRGGSWRHQVKISRCASRSSIAPELQYADYGFRIACDATS